MKHNHGKLKKAGTGILKAVIFVGLSYGSIKLGMAAGSYISKNEITFVQDMDVQNFKQTISSAWPVINTIYNSGKASVSFSGEIRNLVRSVFDFDLNNPLTVLNAHSPLFYSYYNTGYQQMLAKKTEFFVEEYEPITDETGGSNQSDQSDQPVQPEPDSNPKEDASSTNLEEGDRKNQVPDQGVVQSGKITVYNDETSFKIDDKMINDLLRQPLNLGLDSSKKGPKVLIVHTHTTESFIKSLSDYNKPGISKWTNDPRSSVVRVGAELAQTLEKKYGIEVLHNATVHDSPNYNLSYVKSLETVTQILKSYPSIKVVLDIHRDAMDGDKMLRAAANINGKSAAQVMFVLGTNEKIKTHTNWKENFKFSLKLPKKLNEKYPGLAKPIFISSYRYNQHVSNGALIIEIGGDGNTLDEAIESARYMADVINDVINVK